MRLRRYRSSDCNEMAQLFYDTVHTVNAADYTREQLDAWADKNVDITEWDKSFLKHYTVVAVDKDKIAGFGDMDFNGYLDRLYVHRNYQGQGVGTAICDCLEQWIEDRGKDETGKEKTGRYKTGRFKTGKDKTERYETGSVTTSGEVCTAARVVKLSVHASVTARPFFERRGYRVVKEQTVERKGQRLVNYSMVKDIGEKRAKPCSAERRFQ